MTVEDLLRAKREEILRVCAKYGAYNVQVFGSVARGESDEQSYIDLIVDFEPGAVCSTMPGFGSSFRSRWMSRWMWWVVAASSPVSVSARSKR